MTSHTNPRNDQDDLTLALKLSLLSSDAFDEQVAQLNPGGPSSAKPAHPPAITCSNDVDKCAPASNLSQPPSDTPDVPEGQGIEPHFIPVDNQVAPVNEHSENDLDLALMLSQLPADIFDEQVGELNQPRTAAEGDVASLRMAISVLEVRMLPPFWRTSILKGVLGQYERSRGYHLGDGVERRLPGIDAG